MNLTAHPCRTSYLPNSPNIRRRHLLLGGLGKLFSAATLGIAADESRAAAAPHGVPAILVNRRFIHRMPERWGDLLRDEYRGKIGAIDLRHSARDGRDLAVFLAWVTAAGGDANNIAPGLSFARVLYPRFAAAPASFAAFANNDIALLIDYDRQCHAYARQLRTHGIECDIVIPDAAVALKHPMRAMAASARIDLPDLIRQWRQVVVGA